MAGLNEEQREDFLGGSFLGRGVFDEGDEVMISGGSTTSPTLGGWAKALTQASDDEKSAGLVIEQTKFGQQAGSQPQGIDAVVSDVPMGDGRKTTLGRIVEFHDSGYLGVVVGGEEI